MGKEFNSQMMFWVYVSLFWNTNMAAVKTLYGLSCLKNKC